jgi:hypothetical protein
MKYADALKEAGARRIDIYTSPAAWAQNDLGTIAKYEALIDHIRKIGLEIAISPEFNYGELQIHRFSDWESRALPAYGKMASRFRPDVLVVIHEPTTMAKRMGIETTPSEWKAFVAKAARIVEQASPDTRTGAGAQHYEMAFYKKWLSIPDLDIMTLNIYNIGKLKTYNKMIRMAREAHKKVYIGETWRFPPQEPGSEDQTLEAMAGKGIGLKKFERIDRKWLDALATYANAWDLESITPFWTSTFFKYVEQDGSAISFIYNAEVAEAVKNGERTDTFKTYKELSERYGKRSQRDTNGGRN